MIKEDYVSFETSKLLKEKGVDFDTDQVYTSMGRAWEIDMKQFKKQFGYEVSNYIQRPTLQMAMKWLREVHKCYTHICPFYPDMKYNEPPKWLVAVDYNGEAYPTLPKRFDSYEEAVEAALKYTLENLIL